MHGATHTRGAGGGFDDAAIDYDGATRSFDEVERLHLRKRLVPDFGWLDFDQPSPRHALRVPLRQARVGLVATGGSTCSTSAPPGRSARSGWCRLRPRR